jgi:HD-like signal output (HDOD) protein
MVIDCFRSLDEAAVRQPPIAAQQALAVARDPMSSSLQLLAIFERDPALTHALLRMANSQFYHRGSERCASIAGAIQLVGVRGVEAIVTINMIEGLMCRPGNAYAALLSNVWSHMTRTAPVARVLSPAFGTAAEMGFTLGLLHDVGKLVVFDYLTVLRTRHRREIRVSERVLFDMLNRLHEPLGTMAALHWNLGMDAAQAIACHHHEPPPETPNRLGELLCVSERVDHAMRTGFPLDLDRLWVERELTADRQEVRALLESNNIILMPARDLGLPLRAAA